MYEQMTQTFDVDADEVNESEGKIADVNCCAESQTRNQNGFQMIWLAMAMLVATDRIWKHPSSTKCGSYIKVHI